ncbi:MAG: YkgJ family cysteine cluster protein [Desulfobulbaceae bacterium]|nr:YkgJ family cysteine cluster protein [Desulfobulbaceae bacterium]
MADSTSNSQTSGKSLFGTDTNPSNILPTKLGLDSQLKFRCHPKVSCFTACCGNINIILTPYDILRLRKAINLPASEFLLRFTIPVFLEKTDMPGVKIHLDADGRCPFVTPEGCTIYPYRPTTCRYYPVGMSFFHEAAEGGTSEEFYFLVKEPHCKGHAEDQTLTIREWRADQGIDESDEMNKEWMELVMRRKSFGMQATLSEAAQKMFFMASTDLDKFKDFVFTSSFLSIYEIDQDTLESIRTDDIALMKFSFKYLASSLFGTNDLPIRRDKILAKAEELKRTQEESEKRAEETYRNLREDRDKLQDAITSRKK